MAEHPNLIVDRVLAIILTCLLITPVVVLGQPQKRVVHLRSYGNRQPVEFGLKIADEMIVADKPFVADDDWLRDVSWDMKNTSDKTIVYIEVDLDFHGLGSEGGRVYKFRYGQRPGAQGVTGEPKLLMPGETATFKLSDIEYAEIKQFVEQKQPEEGVGVVMSVVEMRISAVHFSDKSMWEDGSLYHPDPSNPQNMRRVDDNTSEPLTGAAGPDNGMRPAAN